MRAKQNSPLLLKSRRPSFLTCSFGLSGSFLPVPTGPCPYGTATGSTGLTLFRAESGRNDTDPALADLLQNDDPTPAGHAVDERKLLEQVRSA